MFHNAGVKYGYARTSTDDQTTVLQLAVLKRARCSHIYHIYEDKGLDWCTCQAPALSCCLRALRAEDALIVWKPERLGRNLRDLITMLDDLRVRGVKFRFARRGHRHRDPDGPRHVADDRRPGGT